MKIVKLISPRHIKAIVRELKAYKISTSIFISEEELKNIDNPMMIA